jgi:hypothetical protein
MFKLKIMLTAATVSWFCSQGFSAAGGGGGAPDGEKTYAIIGCGHTDTIPHEHIWGMDGRPGFIVGDHTHPGVFTINIDEVYKPDLKADITKDDFSAFSESFDTVYAELVAVVSPPNTHKNGYSMVKPGGVYLFDGLDIYSQTAIYRPRLKSEDDPKIYLHKVPKRNEAGEVIGEETIRYIDGGRYRMRFTNNSDREVQGIEQIWFQEDNPFVRFSHFIGADLSNPELNDPKIEFLYTPDTTVYASFQEIFAKTGVRDRFIKQWISRILGVAEENIFAGTMGELLEQGIDVLDILTPLGAACPRWDGQTFLVVKKPS